jgi:hypothetical protein
MYKKVRLKYIILVIFIIISIFLIIKLSSNIEIFNTKKVSDDILICIGDSILNNQNYVPVGKSVIAYLQNEVKVINVAQDNAKINDVYNQLRRVPYITSNMSIILSVGGNNLLEYDRIETASVKYMELISYINEMYESKLYILNLYYPMDESMKKYYKIISKWNSMLRNTISSKYNNIEIIDISKIINEPTDLVKKIEPSITGGLKIADEIIKSVDQ